MSVTERRVREREFRKKSILKAARKVFSEKGYTDTLMDNIAQEAELGKGTLYRYFSSKEEILIYLIKSGIQELNNLLEQQLDRNIGNQELIKKFIKEKLYFYKDNLDLFKIIFLFIHSMYLKSQDNLQKEIGHLLNQNLEISKRMIKICQDNKVLIQQGFSSEKLAHILEHMILSTIMTWYSKPPAIQEVDLEVQLISQIFLNGVKMPVKT